MRLTRKEKIPNASSFLVTLEEHWKTKHRQQAIDKLGQLEDIEEELGIELKVIFKALKQGLYLKRDNDNIIYFAKSKDIIRCDIIKKYIEIDNFSELSTTIANDFLFFEDYGKTWALTKEELL